MESGLSKPRTSAWSVALTLLLAVLTVLTYLPQYLRIISRRSSHGISPVYVLISAIIATEQLTIILHYLHRNDVYPPEYMSRPATAGDWSNVFQLGLQWVCTTILLFLCVVYTPISSVEIEYSSINRTMHRCQFSRLSQMAYISTWIAFGAVTLLPVVARIIADSKEDFADGLLRGMNCFYITPVCTSLMMLGHLSQARKTIYLGAAESLDIHTLWSQSIVFALLSFTWLYRLQYPSLFWTGERPSIYWKWYLEIGWSAVNCLLWAIVQGILYAVCVYVKSRSGHALVDAGEGDPLLG